MKQEYGKRIDDVWKFFGIYFREGVQVAGRIPYVSPNGINHAPTPEQLISDGRRLLVATIYDQTTHKLIADSYSIIDDETMRQDTIALSTELADLALKDWEMEMVQSDSEMSRHIEDIWDHLGIENAPQITQDKYAAKKLSRSRKP